MRNQRNCLGYERFASFLMLAHFTLFLKTPNFYPFAPKGLYVPHITTHHPQNPGRVVYPRTPALNLQFCSPSEAASEMPPLPKFPTTNNQKFSIKNQKFTRKRA